MAEKRAAEVVVRAKRQITLPLQICNELRIEPGDKLELSLEEGVLVARPKQAVALEALEEIRNALARAGITEEELKEAGRLMRERTTSQRYGTQA
ncbi:MAG: AbrB/MazE/SpoVT family DNA-binding domain-containing protein [Chloroflexota bacterium]